MTKVNENQGIEFVNDWLKQQGINKTASTSQIKSIFEKCPKNSDGTVDMDVFALAVANEYSDNPVDKLNNDFIDAKEKFTGKNGSTSANSSEPSLDTPNSPTSGTNSALTSSSLSSDNKLNTSTPSVPPANITGNESLEELEISKNDTLQQLSEAEQNKDNNEAVNTAKEQVETAKAAYDEALEQFESEDEEIQTRIDDIKQRKSDNDEAINGKKDDIQTIKGDISSTESEISSLQSELNSISANESDYQTIDSETGEPVTDNAAYQAALQKREEIEQKINDAEDKLTELQNNLTQAETKLSDLEAQGSEIDTELNNLLQEQRDKINNSETVQHALDAYTEAQQNLTEVEQAETAQIDANISQLRKNLNEYDNAIQEKRVEKSKETENANNKKEDIRENQAKTEKEEQEKQAKLEEEEKAKAEQKENNQEEKDKQQNILKNEITKQLDLLNEVNKNNIGVNINVNEIKNKIKNSNTITDAVQQINQIKDNAEEVIKNTENKKLLIGFTAQIADEIQKIGENAEDSIEKELSVTEEAEQQEQTEQTKQSEEECLTDPIGIEKDGVTYDFIKYDGDFDSVDDFLGSSDAGIQELFALDGDRNGVVSGAELANSGIMVVRTDAQGHQSIVHISEVEAELGGNLSINLSEINADSKEDQSFKVTVKDEKGNETEYDGYSTYKDNKYFEDTYNYDIDNLMYTTNENNGYTTIDKHPYESALYEAVANGEKDASAILEYQQQLDSIEAYSQLPEFLENVKSRINSQAFDLNQQTIYYILKDTYGDDIPPIELYRAGLISEEEIGFAKETVNRPINTGITIDVIQDYYLSNGKFPDNDFLFQLRLYGDTIYSDVPHEQLNNLKRSGEINYTEEYYENGFIKSVIIEDIKTGNITVYEYDENHKITAKITTDKNNNLICEREFNDNGSFTDKYADGKEKTSEQIVLTALAKNSIDITKDITGNTSPLIQGITRASSLEDAMSVIMVFCDGDRGVAEKLFKSLYGNDVFNVDLSKDNPYLNSNTKLYNQLFDYRNGRYYIKENILEAFSTEISQKTTDEDSTVTIKKEYYIDKNGKLCTRESEKTVTKQDDGSTYTSYHCTYTNLENEEKTEETIVERPQTDFYIDEKGNKHYYDYVIMRGENLIYETTEQYAERLIVEKYYLDGNKKDLTTEEIHTIYATHKLYDDALYDNIKEFVKELNSQGLFDKAKNWMNEHIWNKTSDRDIQEEIEVSALLPSVLDAIEAGKDVSEICEAELDRRLKNADSLQEVYEYLTNYYSNEKALKILNTYINSEDNIQAFKWYLQANKFNEYSQATEVGDINQFEFSVDRNGKIVLTAKTNMHFTDSYLLPEILIDGFIGFNKQNPISADKIDKLGIIGLKKPTEQENVHNAVYRFWTNGGEATETNIDNYIFSSEAYDSYNTDIISAYNAEQTLPYAVTSPEDMYQFFLKKNENNQQKAIEEFNEYFEMAMKNVPSSELGGITSISVIKTNKGDIVYEYEFKGEKYTITPDSDTTYLCGIINVINSNVKEKQLLQKQAYEKFISEKEGKNLQIADTFVSFIKEDENAQKEFIEFCKEQEIPIDVSKIGDTEYIKKLMKGENGFALSGYIMSYTYNQSYKNLLGENKLGEMINGYEIDMKNYASTISKVLTLGTVAASMFFPVLAPAAMYLSYTDNFIDLVNMASNHQNDDYGAWLKEFGMETITKAAYMGASNLAGSMAMRTTGSTVMRLNNMLSDGSKLLDIVNNPNCQHIMKIMYEILIETGMNIPMTYALNGGKVDCLDEFIQNVFYDSLPFIRVSVLKQQVAGFNWAFDEKGNQLDYKVDLLGNKYFTNPDTGDIVKFESKNGNYKATYEYGPYGKVIITEEGFGSKRIVYQENGKTTKYVEMIDGKTYTTEYKYEENTNKPKSAITTDENGKFIRSETYNENGTLKSRTVADELDGKPVRKTEEFDDQGRSLKKSITDETGKKLISAIEYTYADNASRPIREKITTYNDNGTSTKIRDFKEYDPVSGKPSVIVETNDNGTQRIIKLSYDIITGKVIDEQITDKVKLNSEGKLIVCDENGEHIAELNNGKYTYVDETGNKYLYNPESQETTTILKLIQNGNEYQVEEFGKSYPAKKQQDGTFKFELQVGKSNKIECTYDPKTGKITADLQIKENGKTVNVNAEQQPDGTFKYVSEDIAENGQKIVTEANFSKKGVYQGKTETILDSNDNVVKVTISDQNGIKSVQEKAYINGELNSTTTYNYKSGNVNQISVKFSDGTEVNFTKTLSPDDASVLKDNIIELYNNKLPNNDKRGDYIGQILQMPDSVNLMKLLADPNVKMIPVNEGEGKYILEGPKYNDSIGTITLDLNTKQLKYTTSKIKLGDIDIDFTKMPGYDPEKQVDIPCDSKGNLDIRKFKMDNPEDYQYLYDEVQKSANDAIQNNKNITPEQRALLNAIVGTANNPDDYSTKQLVLMMEIADGKYPLGEVKQTEGEIIKSGDIQKVPEKIKNDLGIDAAATFKYSYVETVKVGGETGETFVNYYDENGTLIARTSKDGKRLILENQGDGTGFAAFEKNNSGEYILKEYSTSSKDATYDGEGHKIHGSGGGQEKSAYVENTNSTKKVIDAETTKLLDELGITETTTPAEAAAILTKDLIKKLNAITDPELTAKIKNANNQEEGREAIMDYIKSKPELYKEFQALCRNKGTVALDFGVGNDDKLYFALNGAEVDSDLSTSMGQAKNAYDGGCSESYLRTLAGNQLEGKRVIDMKIMLDKENKLTSDDYPPCSTCRENFFLWFWLW